MQTLSSDVLDTVAGGIAIGGVDIGSLGGGTPSSGLSGLSSPSLDSFRVNSPGEFMGLQAASASGAITRDFNAGGSVMGSRGW